MYTDAVLRTFIAIGVPSEIKDKLEKIQHRFKILGLNATWVKPENQHLTLKFLGETGADQIQMIRHKLAEALTPYAPFRLSLDSLGVFPHARNPRVLWVGLKDEEGTLARLQSALQQALVEVGFDADPKPFSPHLTLARIKSPKGKKKLQDELEALNQQGIDPHPFDVGAVQLYESQLTPKGSIYTELANFTLNP